MKGDINQKSNMDKLNSHLSLDQGFSQTIGEQDLRLGPPTLKGPKIFEFHIYKFVEYVVYMYVRAQKIEFDLGLLKLRAGPPLD